MSTVRVITEHGLAEAIRLLSMGFDGNYIMRVINGDDESSVEIPFEWPSKEDAHE